MKSKINAVVFCSLIVLTTIIQTNLFAQSGVSKDTLMLAAREIIDGTTYCGLVTIDETGQPQVRTMNPFPPNDQLITWFATSRDSRKVKEIRNNPKVSVYFADHVNAKGYVNITGRAEVIDDKELLMSMKRDYWQSMPNWQEIFVLIKIVPVTIEVVNYKHGLTNDPKTFKAPSIAL
ncbi:MAG TPA: pyridoxamine 5'-phosphate oxidase family protein [Lentimicrobium sp.]|nr:pyridoxamine 5'-phosphate oxidase family protein [Lentimicrobium sp.]